MDLSSSIELSPKTAQQEIFDNHERSVPKLDSKLDIKRSSRNSLDTKLNINNFHNGDTDFDANYKRSHPEDDDIDEQESVGKRREGDGKVSRKLGRKPITSEPTTKRKAQNRAAQRAFRERKERYLRDLEAKVEDLKMASESANHENSILRTQIENITSELQEYREKFPAPRNHPNCFPSSNTQSVGLSVNGLKSYNMRSPNEVKFDFDFPSFGHIQNHPVDTENSRATCIANSLTPNYYDQISSHSQSLSYVVSKPPPLDFNLVNSQVCETEASNNPESLCYQISDDNNLSLFDLFPSDGEISKSDTKILNELSPRIDFTNENASDEYMVSLGSLSSPTEQSASLVPASKLTAQPRTHIKSSLFSLMVSGDETLNEYPGGDFTHSRGTKSNGLKNINLPAPVSGSESKSEVNPENLELPFFLNSIDWVADQKSDQTDSHLVGEYREQQEIILPNNPVNSDNILDNPLTPVLPDVSSTEPDVVTPIDNRKYEEEKLGSKQDRDKLRKYKSNCNIVQKCPGVNSGDIDLDNLCSELKNKAKCSESSRKIKHFNHGNILKIREQNCGKKRTDSLTSTTHLL